MAYAQELKNLVAEIKIGHKDRTARIGEIKRETRDILGEADDYMRGVAAELKEMAKALKDFLAKSEEARKKDFIVTMQGIQAKIKEIQGNVKDFLVKSEKERMTDFKATMKDIADRVNNIKETVKGMLDGYKVERKEAAGYWAKLGGKDAVTVEETEEESKKKKGKSKK